MNAFRGEVFSNPDQNYVEILCLKPSCSKFDDSRYGENLLNDIIIKIDIVRADNYH